MGTSRKKCKYCSNLPSIIRFGRPRGFCSTICKDKYEQDRQGECADCGEPIIARWNKTYCNDCYVKRSTKN